MKLQVLITTMYAVDFSVIEKLNLKDVDVLIGNQTDFCGYQEMELPDRNVHGAMISTNTTGLGLNRDILLAHATGDILLFADDDMYFSDNFKEEVLKAFACAPDADAVKFYCVSTNQNRPLSFKQPSSFHRVRLHEITSAGVPALAVKRERLQKYDLCFPTSIGAGRHYGSGEDTLFYKDCLKAGLKIYVSPVLLAEILQEDSTWFRGYNETFFVSAGYLYAKIYGVLCYPLIFRHAYRLRSEAGSRFSYRQMIRLMRQGIAEYRK